MTDFLNFYRSEGFRAGCIRHVFCLAALTGIIAAATPSSAGPTIRGCENLCSSSFCEVGHEILGRGVVRYSWRGYAHGAGGTTEFVEACRSGAQVIFSTLWKVGLDPGQTPKVEVDIVKDAERVLRTAERGKSKIGFEELSQRLTDVGAKVTRQTALNESCARHQAFPEQRGNKTKFEWYE